MNDLSTRVIHSYLTHLPFEVIARIEKINIRDVERIVGKAVGVPRKYMRLER